FANMYPSAAASARGYQWTNKLGAEFAMAADLNPGPGDKPPYDNLTAVTLTSPNSIRFRGNSGNHENEGQNVLYGDGHVVYQSNCLVGVGGDNIYVNRNGQTDQSPVDKDDSVLVPVGG